MMGLGRAARLGVVLRVVERWVIDLPFGEDEQVAVEQKVHKVSFIRTECPPLLAFVRPLRAHRNKHALNRKSETETEVAPRSRSEGGGGATRGSTYIFYEYSIKCYVVGLHPQFSGGRCMFSGGRCIFSLVAHMI